MREKEIIKYFDDVNYFHDKTEDILFLLQRFVKKFNKIDSEFKFFSSLFIDEKLEKTSCAVTQESKKLLNSWDKEGSSENLELQDGIVKIELSNNKIFISKRFDGEREGSYVLAGYIIHSTLEFRIFVTELIDKKSTELLRTFFDKI